ncbi:glycoside hydrolase family 76 protein [Actinocatenispora rupis]|uniref:glycoside hydrolase family 76 protein n=1 Tax=Actinocatenispora rupis TaxID=519421 RepID=UPI001943B0C8|nr:glycoside hydrolase family 76 protein [Actinocatenispora rupis]
MWTRAGRRLVVGAVAGCLVLMLGAAPVSAAHGGEARSRAAAAVTAMMGWYDTDSGRWDRDAPWWQSGNALQSLLDYVAATGDRRYLSVAAHTIDVQRAPLPWWPEGGGDFRADSTDDTGWWALALVRMYDLTGDQRYLDIAAEDEDYMGRYWDPVCGGGLWWDIPTQTYKNAISTELYIELAAALHNRIPGDRAHLARAMRAWRWFAASGMIGPGSLVNDGLTSGCANNGGTTWTYNQGVVLGGLAELYRATGDRTLLAQARRIADAVVSGPELTHDGVLTEPCEPAGSCNADQAAFKGVFARNLATLDRVLPGRPYRGFLAVQADRAYADDRDSTGRYGVRWCGPYDGASIGSQESAVALLTATL